MASRNIADLSPAMQTYHYQMMFRCSQDPVLKAQGITVLVTCTYRSGEEQDKLYAQGRTAPGRIVTRAKAGQSKHNTVNEDGQPSAEAFDIVPLRGGKPVWGTAGDDLVVWQRIGAHGVAAGLKWYGSPGSSFKEFPHFQNPDV